MQSNTINDREVTEYTPLRYQWYITICQMNVRRYGFRDHSKTSMVLDNLIWLGSGLPDEAPQFKSNGRPRLLFSASHKDSWNKFIVSSEAKNCFFLLNNHGSGHIRVYTPKAKILNLECSTGSQWISPRTGPALSNYWFQWPAMHLCAGINFEIVLLTNHRASCCNNKVLVWYKHGLKFWLIYLSNMYSDLRKHSRILWLLCDTMA